MREKNARIKAAQREEHRKMVIRRKEQAEQRERSEVRKSAAESSPKVGAATPPQQPETPRSHVAAADPSPWLVKEQLSALAKFVPRVPLNESPLYNNVYAIEALQRQASERIASERFVECHQVHDIGDIISVEKVRHGGCPSDAQLLFFGGISGRTGTDFRSIAKNGFPLDSGGVERDVYLFGETMDVAMGACREQGCALLCLVDLGELLYSNAHVSTSDPLHNLSVTFCAERADEDGGHSSVVCSFADEENVSSPSSQHVKVSTRGCAISLDPG